MWTRIISAMSFLMQAVLVIAAVLLFSFFDPFNIFGSKKKTLKDTPISVTSIQEIGELITAEYYGEVLGSLQEVNIEQLDSNVYRLGKLDSTFAFAMADMRSKNLEFKGLFRRKKIENYFENNYGYIRSDPYYAILVEYLKEDLHVGTERQVLKYFYDNDDLKNSKPGDIKTAVLEKLKSTTRKNFLPDKKLLKKQIVMLGRGSVKAGYKFGTFNESNFKYSPASNVVFFIGLKPEILNCDINPWFIPEKKVKGFELILYTGKANNPAYITQVKAKCLAELRESAMRQDILSKAETNARENLKGFFSLLLDKPVDDVIFMNTKMDVYLYDLKFDTLITNNELSVIDSIISEFNRGNTRKDLKEFMDSVLATPFEFNNEKDTLNCFSSFANSITADNEVDSLEYETLKSKWKNISSGKPVLPYDSCFFNLKDSLTLNEQRINAFKISLETVIKNTDKLTIHPSSGNKMEFSKKNHQEVEIKSKLDSLIIY